VCPSADATDISLVEAPLVEREWKANHAVRDDTLVQKLCNALKNILGDTLLSADDENQLLSGFSPRVQRLGVFGQEANDWTRNPSERHVSLFEVQQFRLIFGTVRFCWTKA